MYRRIVLAYDGSREGACALRQGAELAQSVGAEVLLLAIVTVPAGVIMAEAVGPATLRETEEALYQDILDDGLARLSERGLKAQGRIAHGVAVDEIVGAAREIGADLIVVGHRRKGPLARWWSGSVGSSLLPVAPCSLLIAVAETEGKGTGA